MGPDVTFNSRFDAFVAKVNASRTAFVYAGYIGGTGLDVGIGIAVDGTGNAYVTGWTDSPQSSFPVTPGPDVTFNGERDILGEMDAFVAKVNPSGTAFVYAGYIGGADDDLGAGIALDGEGSPYVTGRTSSPETSFPSAVGPDVTFNGFVDAFVAKVSRLGDNEIMPHIAVGGVWGTTLTLVNTGDETITFPLRFWTPAGDPWAVFVEGRGSGFWLGCPTPLPRPQNPVRRIERRPYVVNLRARGRSRPRAFDPRQVLTWASVCRETAKPKDPPQTAAGLGNDGPALRDLVAGEKVPTNLGERNMMFNRPFRQESETRRPMSTGEAEN